MTLTEMFNICDECAYCPSLCGSDPEICVREYAKLHQQPAEEDDMTDCKHEFVYDELHGEIVCKFCGYVLTAEDKQSLHKKAFERMEEEEGAG